MTDWTPPTGQPGLFLFQDPPSGLLAVVVIDDTTLGPAAGGIRTRHVEELVEAVQEAAGLARAMTIKCALAGLKAGGGKGLVVDHSGLNRPAAFAKLGQEIEKLGGLFRTAGDLGTRPEDLAAMAEHCQYVHHNEGDLAKSVARTHLRCIEALAKTKGHELSKLRIAVQGAGAIGGAVARELSARGVAVMVSDLVPSRAEALAAELGATAISNDAFVGSEVDILAPCAIGGVINDTVAAQIRAWGICGAANNVFADEQSERALHERGLLIVPDVLASSGGVIDGIGETVMGLEDRTPLLDAIGDRATELLSESRRTGLVPSHLAVQWADKALSLARSETSEA